MARLYADEQYPYPVVEFLRALGHDVLTVFPSHASVSPGLTVIANALRVGDRLIEQLK